MNKWTTRLHDKLRLDTYVIRINCQVLKTTLLSFSNSIAAGTKVFCFPSQRYDWEIDTFNFGEAKYITINHINCCIKAM